MQLRDIRVSNKDLEVIDSAAFQNHRQSSLKPLGSTLSPQKISQKRLDNLIASGNQQIRSRFNQMKGDARLDRDYAKAGSAIRQKNLSTLPPRITGSKTDLSPTRLPNLDRVRLALPPDFPGAKGRGPQEISGLKRYLNQKTPNPRSLRKDKGLD